jgi:hypothetical protein
LRCWRRGLNETLFLYASYPHLSSGFEVDQLSPTTVSFAVTSCVSQEARQRMDMGLFPCREVCQGQFEGLARAIPPGAWVTCVACAPHRSCGVSGAFSSGIEEGNHQYLYTRRYVGRILRGGTA